MPNFLKRKNWNYKAKVHFLSMAGKITHIEVLAQTIKHLDHGTEEQRKIATLLLDPSYVKYANLGAIAPDIFYYFHFLNPMRSSKAQFWGDIHHHKNPFQLILSFLEELRDMEEGINKNKLMAFTYGFICHCSVDIVTHPYIFYISGDYYNSDPKISSAAQINHLKVEFALDAYLLNFRWGMSPFKYHFNQYIDVRLPNKKEKMDPVVWEFWRTSLKKTYPSEYNKNYIGSEKKIIPGDLINDSYLGFMQFHELLDSRSTFTRGLLKVLDFLTLYKFKSSVLVLPAKKEIDIRIMNNDEKPWYYPALPSKMSRESFIDLVNRSADESMQAFTKSLEFLNGDINKDVLLKLYDGYNLDTGIKFQDVISMKEFSPL